MVFWLLALKRRIIWVLRWSRATNMLTVTTTFWLSSGCLLQVFEPVFEAWFLNEGKQGGGTFLFALGVCLKQNGLPVCESQHIFLVKFHDLVAPTRLMAE